jgi:hypothetical protein
MLPSLALELHCVDRLPFIRRLRHFLEDHGFDEIPALVLQCDAHGARALKLDSQELANILLNGAGEYSDGDWWSGFSGASRFKVFDGVASKDGSAEPKWATEFHEDGHLLAVIRLVAYEGMEGADSAILNAFKQFGLLVQRLHAATGVASKLGFTASLVNCKDVSTMTMTQYGKPRLRPLGRDFYAWPVLNADSVDEISGVCEQMRLRMARLFP